MENPFRTLGLTQEILAELNDSQIATLVQSSYRTLAKIHHPDVLGGNSNKFKEIQAAFGELDQEKDLEKYKFHKAWYLKPKKSKLKSLADDYSTAVMANELIRKSLLSFWETILIDSTDYFKQPLWKLRSKRIIIRDVSKEKNIDQELGIKSRIQLTRNLSSHIYQEIEIGKNGKLRQWNVSVTDYNRRLNGDVPSKDIFPSKGQSAPLYIQRKRQGATLEGSMLLGCLRIDSSKVSGPKEQMDISYNNPANPEYGQIIALGSTEQGVSGNLEFDRLEPFLKNLTPNIGPLANSIANYLVLMRYNGNEPRFKILGNILRIKEK